MSGCSSSPEHRSFTTTPQAGVLAGKAAAALSSSCDWRGRWPWTAVAFDARDGGSPGASSANALDSTTPTTRAWTSTSRDWIARMTACRNRSALNEAIPIPHISCQIISRLDIHTRRPRKTARGGEMFNRKALSDSKRSYLPNSSMLLACSLVAICCSSWLTFTMSSIGDWLAISRRGSCAAKAMRSFRAWDDIGKTWTRSGTRRRSSSRNLLSTRGRPPCSHRCNGLTSTNDPIMYAANDVTATTPALPEYAPNVHNSPIAPPSGLLLGNLSPTSSHVFSSQR